MPVTRLRAVPERKRMALRLMEETESFKMEIWLVSSVVFSCVEESRGEFAMGECTIVSGGDIGPIVTTSFRLCIMSKRSSRQRFSSIIA